jgi:two-component system, chemotaxis family, sensor kinase CheA
MTNSKYQNFYLDTANEQLKKLSQLFLIWEKQADDKYLIEDILHLTHAMKGAASTMSYKKTAQVLHALEDIFYAILHDSLVVSDNILDNLFKILQVLEKNLYSITNKNKEIALSSHISALQKLIKHPKKVSIKSSKIKTKQRDPLSTLNHSQSYFHTPPDIVVPTTKLDKIQSVIDSLVINKMNVRANAPTDDGKFLAACLETDKIVADLRREVAELRMMSVAQIFTPLPRLVREIAREEGKKVDLIIEDNNLSLDKSILDDLMDVVIQLLRNAVVHGISKEQVDGQIIVRTAIESDQVKIMVADNGQGIDWQQVLDLALQKKIVTVKESKKMVLKDIKALIFDPRFSSQTKINLRSGRGVGLSLVKKRVNDLQGKIIFDSSKSKGTRFTVYLPLPISVFRSLIFKLSHFDLALPLSAVQKVVKLSKFVDFKQQKEFTYKKIKYAVISPQKILGIRGLSLTTQNVVILKYENKAKLLPIPQMMREEEVVVKRTPPVLKNNPLVNLVAIAADGRPVLILDIHNLFN